MALLRKAKWMMIVMPWLEMQLLESFLMFFYTVPEKKSAVPELSGCYHLQCMLAITQPFNKCFLKFRFAIPLQVKNFYGVIFPPFSYLWELLVCIGLLLSIMVFWLQQVYWNSRRINACWPQSFVIKVFLLLLVWIANANAANDNSIQLHFLANTKEALMLKHSFQLLVIP